MSDKEEQPASTSKPKSKYEYETIETISKKFESGAANNNLDKINLYAVITFIKPPKSVSNSSYTPKKQFVILICEIY